MILPSLLCLGEIHRVFRILFRNAVFCTDITAGLLPVKMVRLTCADRSFACNGATFRSGCVVRCCARLHYCASISASLS